MSRLTRRRYTELSEQQREVFDKIAAGRTGVEDGHIGGPFDSWLLNAEMARRISGLGDMFRFRTSVDRRYVELVILVVGRYWRAQYEWYAHEPMARQAGLPEGVIAAIREGVVPEFDDERDRVAWEVVTGLLRDHAVEDGTYRRAVDLFGEQGVAEIVNLAGYYTMVSMTLNTFEVPLPEGAEFPL